tara:strand:+ start:115 stop:258 length:144 start_codon:yes stop_codon:yes gene_type:complete
MIIYHDDYLSFNDYFSANFVIFFLTFMGVCASRRFRRGGASLRFSDF